MKTPKTFTVFLGLIFKSFFRWWWASITGVATFLSYWFGSKINVISLSPIVLSLFIFFGFALLFLMISSVYQSWLIYISLFGNLRVVSMQKDKNKDSEYTVLLEGNMSNAQNVLVELKTYINSIEVPIALLEINEMNSKGYYQASTIWFSPGHKRDFRMNRISVFDIRAVPLITLSTIQKAKDSIVKTGENYE